MDIRPIADLVNQLYTLFATTVTGLTSIRAFKAEGFFEHQNVNTLNRSQGPFYFRFEGTCFLRVVLTWMTVSVSSSTSELDLKYTSIYFCRLYLQ